MLKIYKVGARFEPVAMIADRRVFHEGLSSNPVLGSPTDTTPTCRIAARRHRPGRYLISPWRPKRPTRARWDGGYVLPAALILMNGSPLLTSEL
jgi:hypothetical protein